jgi:hypothetical protein
MSRPALLLLIVLVALVVIACGGGGDPAVTEAPKTPRQTAERWLELWKDGKYSEMYQLVSAASAAKISQQDFVDRYTAITDEAKLTGIDYEIRTSDEHAKAINFKATFHSSFFDDWPESNTIPLVQDSAASVSPSPSSTPPSNAWKVDWTPSLFFTGINAPISSTSSRKSPVAAQSTTVWAPLSPSTRTCRSSASCLTSLQTKRP